MVATGDDKSPWQNSCTQAGHAHNRSFAHDQALLAFSWRNQSKPIEDNGNHSLYLSRTSGVFRGENWWRLGVMTAHPTVHTQLAGFVAMDRRYRGNQLCARVGLR